MNDASLNNSSRFSNTTHSFDINLAQKFGVHAAILIRHFQFWIEFNMKRGVNEHDGRTWTYGSYEEISSHFSYLTQKQVRTAISKLIKSGVIVKGNFNKLKYDHTNWYAFVDQEIYTACPNGQTKKPNRADQKTQMGRPIPDTKKDTKNTLSVEREDANAVPEKRNPVAKANAEANEEKNPITKKDSKKTCLEPEEFQKRTEIASKAIKDFGHLDEWPVIEMLVWTTESGLMRKALNSKGRDMRCKKVFSPSSLLKSTLKNLNALREIQAMA